MISKGFVWLQNESRADVEDLAAKRWRTPNCAHSIAAVVLPERIPLRSEYGHAFTATPTAMTS
jgi:hypothetical protein